MKHIRKFNESNTDDIFDDVQNLIYLLTDFSDNGFEFHIKRSIFYIKSNGDLDSLGDTKSEDFSKWRGKNDQVCAYVIIFEELFDNEVAVRYVNNSHGSSTRLGYSIPDDKYYLFMEKLKRLQGVIERSGYIYSYNMESNGVMILEKYK